MTTIRYEQANPVPGKILNVTSTDVFIFHIHKAFGKFPVELDAENLERLEGMAACYAEPNPFKELIREIHRLGSIRVWADYGNDVTIKQDDRGTR